MKEKGTLLITFTRLVVMKWKFFLKRIRYPLSSFSLFILWGKPSLLPPPLTHKCPHAFAHAQKHACTYVCAYASMHARTHAHRREETCIDKLMNRRNLIANIHFQSQKGYLEIKYVGKQQKTQKREICKQHREIQFTIQKCEHLEWIECRSDWSKVCTTTERETGQV